MTDRGRPRPRPGSGSSPRGERPGRTSRRGSTTPREAASSRSDSSAESLFDDSVDGASDGKGPRRIFPRVMGRRSKQKKERTFFGLSTGKAVVLAVVVCALALTLAVPLRTYIGQRSEAEAVAAEQLVLEERVSELQIRKDQTEDPAYIKAQARERLGFVVPGETPYQVQLPGARAYSDIKKDSEVAPSGPWYSTLWSTAVQ